MWDERLAQGWCQSDANQSPLVAGQQVLADEKVAPFAKRGVSFLFKPNSGVYVPFEIEVIVHLRLKQGELLQTSHPTKS